MAPTAADPKRKPFVRDILGRSDYAIISEVVEPDSRVLDLGCGEGELLNGSRRTRVSKGAESNWMGARCSAPLRAAFPSTRAISMKD